MAQNPKRIVKDPKNPKNYVVAMDPTVNKRFVEFQKPWYSAGRQWAPGEIAGFDPGDAAQLAIMNGLIQSGTAKVWTAE